jgi:NAD+ synthase
MNSEAVVQHLVTWLQERVAEAGASGLVLGVSGGVDSAVVAALAKRAFPNDCLALILPCESNLNDLIHAQLVLERFKIPYRIVELDNAYQLLLTKYQSYLKLDGKQGQLLRANLKPRLRMMTLYYSAQARNYLVAGTSNRSEISVGYATKYGDTGVDIQPLGDLLKKEVYELARYLDVPSAIINKPPSGGLWEGQTDEEEMGISYEDLDNYLDKGDALPEVEARIKHLQAASQHKRVMPPLAIIPDELK